MPHGAIYYLYKGATTQQAIGDTMIFVMRRRSELPIFPRVGTDFATLPQESTTGTLTVENVESRFHKGEEWVFIWGFG